MKKGDLISVTSPVRFFDDRGDNCIVLGPALVLELNEWDITCLVDNEILWTNWYELGEEEEKIEHISLNPRNLMKEEQC